jgi:DNA adenine methylase
MKKVTLTQSKNRPFLKWAGNKYALVEKITKFLPHGERLVEPFVGSGALFLNTQFEKYLLAETNPDLINLHKFIKNKGEEFATFAETFINPKNNNKRRYYELRQEFNSTEDPWLKSGLFIYLNRHGYNGLCRYNKSWQFNVPFGSYVRPYFPQKELLGFHQRARKARFVCQDFRKTFKQVKPGDVIYCDPPYTPLSTTANFTNYGAQVFTETDQIDLAQWAERFQARGIPVIISNHDTPFTRKLYAQAMLKSFKVSRTISCNSQRRGEVKELLAIYLPK